MLIKIITIKMLFKKAYLRKKYNKTNDIKYFLELI